MLKKKKFIIGGVVLALAVAYLGYTGLSNAATYYYEVGELLAKGSAAYGENVKINGQVVTGSLQREEAGRLLAFTMVDTSGNVSLPVVFRGVAPDTFKEGALLVAEGQLLTDGIFQANTLLPKCPSKYEPES
ncbi:MAG: hypothetical protein A2Z29_03735 [Chloroflexi bacterium RBG_16_56_11]|nr:MAG: hypothetical protein A2Z29_03735 [Chloroflexi bacterium RBG_16_56_11]